MKIIFENYRKSLILENQAMNSYANEEFAKKAEEEAKDKLGEEKYNNLMSLPPEQRDVLKQAFGLPTVELRESFSDFLGQFGFKALTEERTSRMPWFRGIDSSTSNGKKHGFWKKGGYRIYLQYSVRERQEAMGYVLPSSLRYVVRIVKPHKILYDSKPKTIELYGLNGLDVESRPYDGKIAESLIMDMEKQNILNSIKESTQ
tara:strand:- start:778 stop:1386 length:609 start_codon:yes stop_codon:yes gene_type:complete